MKSITLNENLLQFIFPSENEEVVAQDIRLTVLVDNQRALIIDSGYEVHSSLLRKTLENLGYQPHTLILSHYHPDHAAGAVAFEGCAIYASPHYRRSYEFYKKIFPDQRFLKPTHTVQDGDSLNFGDHQIQFIETPGHSPCSITTIINNTVFHIGDMLAYAGKRLSIPFLASGGDFKTFIESLQRVQQMKPLTLIPAHGASQDGVQHNQSELQRAVHYLQRMLETQGQAPLEKLLQGDLADYDSFSLHEKNLKRLAKTHIEN
jgi:glyoxylase-like metal-dependent hydrolase (beta-lactamase superfamily II)